MEYTSESFSKALGCEKDIGYSLLRFLVAMGLVENLGSKPNPGVKGKQPLLYKVKPEAGKKLAAMLDKVAG